jgi:hypothetical protein
MKTEKVMRKLPRGKPVDGKVIVPEVDEQAQLDLANEAAEADVTIVDEADEVDAPAEETSAETFVRLANYRMGKAIARLRQMHNLAAYEYTTEQVDELLVFIDGEIEDLENALRNVKTTKPIPQLGG